MTVPRTDALITLSVISAFIFYSNSATAQVAPAMDTPVAASAPAPTTVPAPVPTIAAASEAVTQPFVGTVIADKVYVRSGPGPLYYELGHLGKGDLVQIVGSRLGWYQILPPNGTYCMVAKEVVDTDASGGTGTVKADYVRVRAGTALNKTRDPSAILVIVRKGTKLTILGSTDKYYEVAPPDKAYVFISPQFVKAVAAGTDYKVPDLKLPAGTVGPSVTTVTAPTTLPTATAEVSPIPTPPPAPATDSTQPPAMAVTRPAPVPLPPPAATYSEGAYKRFDELTRQYQEELKKPVGHRELDGLIKDFKDLLASKDPMPPSVKQGSEARIADLEKLATIQRLQKENASSAEELANERKALQEQAAAAGKALDEYERTGPFLAQGMLQTSSAVKDKYALVNPATGRTEAYVDPKSAIDIGGLLGKYIGVRGTTHKAEGTEIMVIQVKNATLMPAPAIAKPKP